MVIPLAEYNAVPQVIVGGVPLPPAVPIYPADLLAASTASDIATYRIEVDLCIHYFRLLEAFKAAVLTAMGDALVQAISDPRAGYAVTMEVIQILTISEPLMASSQQATFASCKLNSKYLFWLTIWLLLSRLRLSSPKLLSDWRQLGRD